MPRSPGDMYASALLGVMNSGQFGTGGYANIAPNWTCTSSSGALYFQDDIKLTGTSPQSRSAVGTRDGAERGDAQLVRHLGPDASRFPSSRRIHHAAAGDGDRAECPTNYNGAFMVYTGDTNPRMYDAHVEDILPRAGIAHPPERQDLDVRAGYARYAVPMVTVHPEDGGCQPTASRKAASVLGPLEGKPRTWRSDPFPATNPLLLPPGNSLGRYTATGQRRQFWDGNRHEDAHQRPHQLHASSARCLSGFSRKPRSSSTSATTSRIPACGAATTDCNHQQMDPNLCYKYKGPVDRGGAESVLQPAARRQDAGQPAESADRSGGQLLRPVSAVRRSHCHAWLGGNRITITRCRSKPSAPWPTG